MEAPIAAVNGLYHMSPPIPDRPSPTPRPSAIFGLTPRTKGLCDVLNIFLSYSISMYWLRAWVDMDNATEDASKGKQDAAAGYNE